MKTQLRTSLLLLLMFPIHGYVFWNTSSVSLCAQESNPSSISKRVWDRFFNKKEKVDSVFSDEQSIIDRYDKLYHFFQGNSEAKFDSLGKVGTKAWDDINNLKVSSEHQFAIGEKILDSNHVVFGWHPYWMGNSFKTYNYNLLSHISFYGYIINPNTGLAANDSIVKQWQASDFQKAVTEGNPNTKVLLTLVNYGNENNQLFLNDAYEQQRKLIEEVSNILEATGADGVDLNFEGISANQAISFNRFVKRLKDNLKTKSKDVIITLSVSPADSKVLDLKNLQKSCDFFVLMGYGFQAPKNQKPSPIAPLYGNGSNNLQSAVYGFLTQGVDTAKFVLGLPYYGGRWKTVNGKTTFDKYLTYRQIRSIYDTIPPQYSNDSLNAYYVRDSFTVWFDNEYTLLKKYQFARTEKLRGIGIWALGYDNGYFNLWDLIENNFAITYSTPSVDKPSFATKFAKAVIRYRELLIVCFAFIVCFLFLGFAISLNFSDVRAAFFNNDTYRILFVFGIFMLLVLFYWISKITMDFEFKSDSILMLGLGLILGLLITNIVYFLYQKWKEGLP